MGRGKVEGVIERLAMHQAQHGETHYYQVRSQLEPDPICRAALQLADIAERPFTTVVEQARDAGDFVYFDPPYHPLSKTSKFTAYSRDRFTAEQQSELKTIIHQLAKRSVSVLASNSDCPFIRELYAEFTIETITATRSINSKASQRGKITEVLVVA